MIKTQVFYRCPICGNIIGMIQDAGVVPVCCGQPMEQLTANSVDAAVEKHVPVIIQKDRMITVTVGETPHPMTNEHFISWIYLQTSLGGHRRILKPGDKAEACFCLCEGETPINVFSYCNIHGLWAADC